MFPGTRMRRSRRTEGLRRLAQETALAPDGLHPAACSCSRGSDRREAVSAMPGVERISADLLARRAEAIKSSAVLIFGVPDADEKDERASAAVREDGLVPAAVRALKAARPDLIVITDICVCGYTSHGHCGHARRASGEVENDATLELLGRHGAGPRGRRRRHGRALRDGRRPGPRHPRRARRRRIPGHRHHGLRREVRLELLRPLPRGGAQRAGVRRPALVPVAAGEPPRGRPRRAARRGGRRRLAHGQAGHAVSRRAGRTPRRHAPARSPPTRSAASTPC